MIKQASYMGAYIFGGCVRNYIAGNKDDSAFMTYDMFDKQSIQKYDIYDTSRWHEWNDINIWFKTPEQAQQFINSYGQLKIQSASENNIFQWYALHMPDSTDINIYFKIFISKTYPSNDFNVNRIACRFQKNTYSLSDDLVFYYFSSTKMADDGCAIEKDHKIDNYVSKSFFNHAKMTKQYFNAIKESNNIEEYVKYINQNYIDLGWRVRVIGGYVISGFDSYNTRKVLMDAMASH